MKMADEPIIFNDYENYYKKQKNKEISDSLVDGSYIDQGSDFIAEEDITLTDLYSDEAFHNEEMLVDDLDALEIESDSKELESEIQDTISEDSISVGSDNPLDGVDPVAKAFDVDSIQEVVETQGDATSGFTEGISDNLSDIDFNMDGFHTATDESDVSGSLEELKSTISDVTKSFSVDGIKNEYNEYLDSLKEDLETDENDSIFNNYKPKDINKALNEAGAEKDSFSDFYNNTEDKSKVEQVMKNLFDKLSSPNNRYEVQNLFCKDSFNSEYDKVLKGETSKEESTLDQSIENAEQETQLDVKSAASQIGNTIKQGMETVMQEI
jgi:hypothetical protein